MFGSCLSGSCRTAGFLQLVPAPKTAAEARFGIAMGPSFVIGLLLDSASVGFILLRELLGALH